MRKPYRMLQSNIGIVMLAIIYILLFLPSGVEGLGYLIGESLSALIMMLLLRRFYKWKRSEQIFWFLIVAYIYRVILLFAVLLPVLSAFNFLTLVLLVVLMISDLFRKNKIN